VNLSEGWIVSLSVYSFYFDDFVYLSEGFGVILR